MTKTFCDACETEITDTNPSVVSDYLVFESGKWWFQVVIAKDQQWGTGHLCQACAKQLMDKSRIIKLADTQKVKKDEKGKVLSSSFAHL